MAQFNLVYLYAVQLKPNICISVINFMECTHEISELMQTFWMRKMQLIFLCSYAAFVIHHHNFHLHWKCVWVCVSTQISTIVDEFYYPLLLPHKSYKWQFIMEIFVCQCYVIKSVDFAINCSTTISVINDGFYCKHCNYGLKARNYFQFCCSIVEFLKFLMNFAKLNHLQVNKSNFLKKKFRSLAQHPRKILFATRRGTWREIKKS